MVKKIGLYIFAVVMISLAIFSFVVPIMIMVDGGRYSGSPFAVAGSIIIGMISIDKARNMQC